MDREKEIYLISALSSFLFAVMYAVVELTINWYRVQQLFGWLPSYHNMSAYNWFFTTCLYLFVAFLPLIPLAAESGINPGIVFMGLGNYCQIVLVEDAAFFMLQKRWIHDGEWTTQLAGSLVVHGIVIPWWYLMDLVIMLCFYYLAWKYDDFLAFRSHFFFRAF